MPSGSAGCGGVSARARSPSCTRSATRRYPRCATVASSACPAGKYARTLDPALARLRLGPVEKRLPVPGRGDVERRTSSSAVHVDVAVADDAPVVLEHAQVLRLAAPRWRATRGSRRRRAGASSPNASTKSARPRRRPPRGAHAAVHRVLSPPQPERAHRASPAARRGRSARGRAGIGRAASPSRLIQTLRRPSSFAGTMSWKSDAPTCTWPSRGARCAREELLPVPVRRLVRADLLRDDDLVERHADLHLRRGDVVVVGVREDRELPAARRAAPRARRAPRGTRASRAATRRAPCSCAGRRAEPAHRLGQHLAVARGCRRAAAPARPRGSARAARRRAPRRRRARARRGRRRPSRSACRSSRRSPSAPRARAYAATCSGRPVGEDLPAVLVEPRLRLAVVRAALLDERPERGAVVVLDEVADLVHDDVVEHVVRCEHEPPVEAERALARARAPAAALVAQRDARVRRRRARPPPTARSARCARAPRGGPAPRSGVSRSRPRLGCGGLGELRLEPARGASAIASSISASVARGRTTSSGGSP